MEETVEEWTAVVAYRGTPVSVNFELVTVRRLE